MTGRVSGSPLGQLVLDSGAILALSRGDPRAREILARASSRGLLVVIPTAVLAQVHRPGGRNAAVNRVLNAVGAFPPLTAEVAREAGALLGRTDTTDVVDAVVAAEALARRPSTILTSDPSELSVLLSAGAAAGRVVVLGI